MNWRDDYQRKLMSLEEAASFVESGEAIATGPMTGFPLALVNAITAREDLHGVTFVSGLWMTLPNFLLTETDHRFTYDTLFMGPVERMFLKYGAIRPASVHFHRALDFSAQYDYGCAVMDVSRPDAHGFMSIGPGSSLLGKSAFRAARKVLVQVNPHTPFLIGTEMHIHVSEVDAICEVDQPLFELPDLVPDATEIAIAQMVAERIPDGATLQLGIGKLANAIGDCLTDKKDLGIHTELLTSSMINLYERGVITGRKKTLHPEKMVAAFSIGKTRDYAFLNNNPATEFHPAHYVNNPVIIAKNKHFVSVNNALTVDLTGQVASEALGFAQHSATGGQLDFVRGARMSEGGLSFITLKSTANTPNGTISRISAAFAPGTVVTTPRSDVHCIATEYGIADLDCQTIAERVNRMIAIAHPDFRDQLAREAVDSGLVKASMIRIDAQAA